MPGPSIMGLYQASFDETLTDPFNFQSVLRVQSADYGHGYTLRIKAQGVAWRVMIDGGIGPEEFASGTIPPAAAPSFVRPALPDTLGGTEIRVEMKPVTAGTFAQAEMTWRPVEPHARPCVWGGERERVPC